MTISYTFDVFCSLDGFGTHRGDWGGYGGKQGPEFLAHQAQYDAEQRMVFGADTYRDFVQSRGLLQEMPEAGDPWVNRMMSLPMTVVSRTLQEPLEMESATVAGGDGVEIVARLEEESAVPLRSHGSLSLNRAPMAAGLVDRVQMTIFPVITGQTGTGPVFEGAKDYDLELSEAHTFDGRIQELIYRPTLHR
jgi:dihydrofolate reductase